MQCPRLCSPELSRVSVLRVCVIPPELTTVSAIRFFLVEMLDSTDFYLQRLRGNLKINLKSDSLGRQ